MGEHSACAWASLLSDTPHCSKMPACIFHILTILLSWRSSACSSCPSPWPWARRRSLGRRRASSLSIPCPGCRSTPGRHGPWPTWWLQLGTCGGVLVLLCPGCDSLWRATGADTAFVLQGPASLCSNFQASCFQTVGLGDSHLPSEAQLQTEKKKWPVVCSSRQGQPVTPTYLQDIEMEATWPCWLWHLPLLDAILNVSLNPWSMRGTLKNTSGGCGAQACPADEFWDQNAGLFPLQMLTASWFCSWTRVLVVWMRSSGRRIWTLITRRCQWTTLPFGVTGSPGTAWGHCHHWVSVGREAQVWGPRDEMPSWSKDGWSLELAWEKG